MRFARYALRSTAKASRLHNFIFSLPLVINSKFFLKIQLPKWPNASWYSWISCEFKKFHILDIAIYSYANSCQNDRFSLPRASKALSEACLCWCAQDDELSTSLFNGASPHQLTLLSLAICRCCLCSAPCFYLPNPHRISINSFSRPRRASLRDRDFDGTSERGWVHLQPQDKHLFGSRSAKRRNLGNCLSKQARSLAHTHEYSHFSAPWGWKAEWKMREVNATMFKTPHLKHIFGRVIIDVASKAVILNFCFHAVPR